MTLDDDSRTARLERAIRIKRAAARSRTTELPRRPADRPARLAETQRGLWLLHQMAPKSAAYNLASAARLPAPVDRVRLAEAIEGVVGRHNILRSTFESTPEGVVQQIAPSAGVVLEVEEVDPQEMLETAVLAARRPFDLGKGPLMRAVLFEDSAQEEELLLLTLHHIIADERSLTTLWRELAVAYADPEALPPPVAQFDDFVHWIGRQDIGRETELEFWRQQLTPPPTEFQLPTLAPAEIPAGARGHLLRRTLSAAARRNTREAALRLGITPFMVSAFAFRLLLQRYAPAQGFAFATPATTRSHPATAEMIGYFLNPLLVPVAIDEDDATDRALLTFSDRLKTLLAHQTTPFDSIVESLALTRQADQNPLFQTMFVYQEASPAIEFDGHPLEPLELDLGESKFDLTLFVTTGEDSIDCGVEYRTDRFERVWMENLLDHYDHLLANLDQPSERVADIPLLQADEQSRILEQGVGAPLEAGLLDLVPDQIHDLAVSSPDARALTFEGSHWTYGQLAEQATTIARALIDRGVRPGDRVALHLPRSELLVTAILATHWAGAAYVPLDPQYPTERNRLVLADAEVSIVVSTSEVGAGSPLAPVPVLLLDQLPTPSERWERSPDFTPIPLDAESPAYLLYTSGSTGRPKGVVVTQGNLRASTAARRPAYGFEPATFLLLPSIAFDSSVVGIFWTLTSGGTLVIPTDTQASDPQQLAELTRNEKIKVLLCVPSLWAQLLAMAPECLESLETAIVAGESLLPALVSEHFARLPGTRLYNEYGPTEATVWATWTEITETDSVGPIAIGKPIPGARVRVVDVLDRLVPEGLPGEAVITGPTVAHGYWKQEAPTRERFLPAAPAEAGWPSYRTGDRVSWSSSGELLFHGRRDDQIKLRGYRIEPGDIESALTELAEILGAAVVARGSESGDHLAQLVAFVRTPDGDVRSETWRQTLSERLPHFMVPHRFVALPEFPELPNGKVDRQTLRTMSLPEESAGADEPPASPLEASLFALWQSLLGGGSFGVCTNFFELGGNSLLVIQMIRAIERDHDVRFQAADVFQNPTIRQLAVRIGRQEGATRTQPTHLFPLQPLGDQRPLVVSIPHFFSERLAERFRGERPVYGLRGIGLRAEGNLGRWPSMTALAEDLVGEISDRFPDQEVIMAGYSFGASMAAEATRIMEARGLPVRGLYLVAPMPLNLVSVGPLRIQVPGLRKPVEDLSGAETLQLLCREYNPLTRRPWVHLWRYLSTKPKQHVLCAVGRMKRRVGRPLSPAILHADVRVDRFRLHRHFQPRGITTPTVIFNPREPLEDAAATWQTAFVGPLEVVEIPDPHLSDSRVVEAAELILSHIDSRDASGREAG